ncbi:hypothetical protein SteCoe_36628 [Stentor coeruleus]|uniref:TLC domain-containing protein n=1 Tax=Stentor coeruleus TaxID=5963 RepID=A0A1R2APQ7_9CILI|nr:hypothetical protein SteCoe_36628 [Stentor coeruleus]
MSSNFLWMIPASTIIWASILIIATYYVNLKLPYYQLWDFRCRIYSFFHGFFCIWFSQTIIFTRLDPTSPITFFEESVLSISMGYFLFDCIAMRVLKIDNIIYYIHHIAVLCVVGSALVSGKGAYEIASGFLALEMTNPIYQIKGWLKYLGYKKTIGYLVVEIFFYFAFCVSRFIFGGIVLYNIIISENLSLAVKLFSVGIQLMFYAFLKKIIKTAKRRREEYKERKAKGLKLEWFRPIKKID